jgi:hypothetical protein
VEGLLFIIYIPRFSHERREREIWQEEEGKAYCRKLIYLMAGGGKSVSCLGQWRERLQGEEGYCNESDVRGFVLYSILVFKAK